LSELEWYEMCFPLHQSCHHFQSEQVEVKDMDIPEVDDTNMLDDHDHLINHRLEEEGINTVEKHDYPMNHRLGEESMNMMGIHMVDVEGMNMVEERSTNQRSETTNF
jgi:hypothetical protein